MGDISDKESYILCLFHEFKKRDILILIIVFRAELVIVYELDWNKISKAKGYFWIYYLDKIIFVFISRAKKSLKKSKMVKWLYKVSFVSSILQ